MIPLISWVSAGRFCQSPELIESLEDSEWVPTFRHASKHSYALRVVGDSMTSPYPGTKSYPSGTIIMVDPERPLTNGAKVVASIEGTAEATFKVYSEDSGKKYLKPLNPQYPIIEIDHTIHICGVVFGTLTEE